MDEAKENLSDEERRKPKMTTADVKKVLSGVIMKQIRIVGDAKLSHSELARLGF